MGKLDMFKEFYREGDENKFNDVALKLLCIEKRGQIYLLLNYVLKTKTIRLTGRVSRDNLSFI